MERHEIKIKSVLGDSYDPPYQLYKYLPHRKGSGLVGLRGGEEALNTFIYTEEYISSIKQGQDYEYTFVYHTAKNNGCIYIWGMLVDIETGMVYLDDYEKEEMICQFYLVDLLRNAFKEKGYPYHFQWKDVYKEIQRFKLTLDIESLFTNLLNVPYSGSSATSFIKMYIEGSLPSEVIHIPGSFPVSSWDSISRATHEMLYTALNGGVQHLLQRGEIDLIVGDLQTLEEQRSFQRFYYSLAHDRYQRGTDNKLLTRQEHDAYYDLMDKGSKSFFTNTASSNYVREKGTQWMDTRKIPPHENIFGGLQDLLTTLPYGDEVIYSSDINKVLVEKGFDKLLDKKELAKVVKAYKQNITRVGENFTDFEWSSLYNESKGTLTLAHSNNFKHFNLITKYIQDVS